MEVEMIPAESETCDHEYFDEEDYFIASYEEQNLKLEDRVTSLKNIIDDLKSELGKEKELWLKEVEEAEKLAKNQEQVCSCCCEEENSGGQSSDEPTLNDMTILDYEQKLSVYQEALAKAHAEKRMHLRRHLAANAYKRRLLEVENMCNLELLKVKQNVQCLQPLQAMVSEWHYDHKENVSQMDEEISGSSLKKKDSFLTLDNFANKINAELKDFNHRTSPTLSSLETASSVLQDEDDDSLMIRRLQSMGWYNNEMMHLASYNPLM